MPPDTETFGLAGEDFCYFSNNCPSAYFLIGSAPEGTVKEDGKVLIP